MVKQRKREKAHKVCEKLHRQNLVHADDGVWRGQTQTQTFGRHNKIEGKSAEEGHHKEWSVSPRRFGEGCDLSRSEVL